MEGDSLELVNQVSNLDRPPDWLIKGEVDTIRKIMLEHDSWKFIWTPREGNCLAHNLAKWGMDFVLSGNFRVGDVPPDIVNCDDSAVFAEQLFNGGVPCCKKKKMGSHCLN